MREVLLYISKYILYTYFKETDHIAREVYRTLCNILHGKRVGRIDIYNIQMNQIVYP